MNLPHELQEIDENGKGKQRHDADEVDDRLHLSVDGLFADPFDDTKHDFRSVERRNGKQIKHRKVHADKGRDIQEGLQAACRRLARHLDRRHGPTHRLDADLARQKLAERPQNHAAHAHGISKRMSETREKSFLYRLGVQGVIVESERGEHGVIVVHTFERCVRAQGDL